MKLRFEYRTLRGWWLAGSILALGAVACDAPPKPPVSEEHTERGYVRFVDYNRHAIVFETENHTVFTVYYANNVTPPVWEGMHCRLQWWNKSNEPATYLVALRLP